MSEIACREHSISKPGISVRSGRTATSMTVALGMAVLYAPTVIDLYQQAWADADQSQGPVMFAIAVLLLTNSFWQEARSEVKTAPKIVIGLSVFLLGAMLQLAGRTQGILLFQVVSMVPAVTGVGLIFFGSAMLKRLIFPMVFLCFTAPLPNSIVVAITQPMKIAVSSCVEAILYYFDIPVARSGVILQVGQYRLLVADACAGIHTLFTLEAIGLLYLHLVRSKDPLRNVILPILVVPIGFFANVMRVIVLCLLTYFLGDEVGQGFLHGFAGLLLFGCALLLLIAFDKLLVSAASFGR